jgi:hypothetical protein
MRGRLLFGVATFFAVCFGVGETFFFTCPAWLYVEAAAVWMWGYISSGIIFTRALYVGKVRKQTKRHPR